MSHTLYDTCHELIGLEQLNSMCNKVYTYHNLITNTYCLIKFHICDPVFKELINYIDFNGKVQ